MTLLHPEHCLLLTVKWQRIRKNIQYEHVKETAANISVPSSDQPGVYVLLVRSSQPPSLPPWWVCLTCSNHFTLISTRAAVLVYISPAWQIARRSGSALLYKPKSFSKEQHIYCFWLLSFFSPPPFYSIQKNAFGLFSTRIVSSLQLLPEASNEYSFMFSDGRYSYSSNHLHLRWATVRLCCWSRMAELQLSVLPLTELLKGCESRSSKEQAGCWKCRGRGRSTL